MFGIGGGELIFIMLVVLMLFGSDKIPEIARTMGKAMAQLKHATNDIKTEIQKGAESSGLDQKMINDLTNNINSEINSVKSNILGDSNPLSGITDSFTSEINKVKNTITDENPASTTENTPAVEIETAQKDLLVETPSKTDVVEENNGPIKRKK